MRLIEAGSGPFVVLESVVCENCGPRLWNSFDEFPEVRNYFPIIVRTEFVRTQGSCECGGQVLCATRPIDPTGLPFSDCIEVGPFADGDSILMYEVEPMEASC